VTHLNIHEWGHARFGKGGLTREQAHALPAVACHAPLAHASLFRNTEQMLLYPGRSGHGCAKRAQFGIASGRESLRIATADVSLVERILAEALRRLVTALAVIPAAAALPLVAG
jgi:5-methylcytosine-specific restriction enzyme subunit McrC